MLRMSLDQAHILLNNGVADLTIPFTNRLSEFRILLLKLNTNLHKLNKFNYTNLKHKENGLVALYDNWWLVAYASHVSKSFCIPAELSAIKHKLSA